MNELCLRQVGLWWGAGVVVTWIRTLQRAFLRGEGAGVVLLDAEVERLARGEALQEGPLNLLHKKKNQP